MQPCSISPLRRRSRPAGSATTRVALATVVAVALSVLAGAPLAGQAPPPETEPLAAPGQPSGPPPAAALPPPDAALWVPAPEYLALFAPPLHRDQYRAYVAAQPLAGLLPRLSAEASLLHPPGSWTPRSLGARAAFGESGPYNRFDLARLYVSTPVQVATGPRGDDRGRVVESWMLFSPYPDRAMDSLRPGTLLLVVPVPPL